MLRFCSKVIVDLLQDGCTHRLLQSKVGLLFLALVVGGFGLSFDPTKESEQIQHFDVI